MGIFRSLERRRTIKRLTRGMLSPQKECLNVLLNAFTDERLAHLADKFDRSPLRTLQPSSDASILGQEYHQLSDQLHLFIEQSPNSSALLPVLTETARIMKDVSRNHDPDGNRYPESQHHRPQDIIEYARYFNLSPQPTTDEQKHALLSLTFLTHQQDSEGNGVQSFQPDSSRSNALNSYAKKVTGRIMADPTVDLTVIAEEYLSRTARRAKIQKQFNGEDFYYTDNICDYSDPFIELLVKIKDENNQHCWRDIVELISRDDVTPESLEDALLLGKPYLGVYSLHYMRSVIQTVDTYPELLDSAAAGTPEHWKRREALLHVTLALSFIPLDDEHKHLQDRRITDQRLIDLLINAPESSTIIVDMINERKCYDFNQIKAALKAGSLGSGTL